MKISATANLNSPKTKCTQPPTGSPSNARSSNHSPSLSASAKAACSACSTLSNPSPLFCLCATAATSAPPSVSALPLPTPLPPLRGRSTSSLRHGCEMPFLPTPRNFSNQIYISSTPTPAVSVSPNLSFERTLSSFKKPGNSSPRAPANRVAPPALVQLAISLRAQKKPPSLSSTGCVPRCLPRQINSRVLPPLGPPGQSPHAQPLFGRPAKKTFSAASSAPV